MERQWTGSNAGEGARSANQPSPADSSSLENRPDPGSPTDAAPEIEKALAGVRDPETARSAGTRFSFPAQSHKSQQGAVSIQSTDAGSLDDSALEDSPYFDPDAQSGQRAAAPPDGALPAAFAEVALRVWGESASAVPAAGSAAPAYAVSEYAGSQYTGFRHPGPERGAAADPAAAIAVAAMPPPLVLEAGPQRASGQGSGQGFPTGARPGLNEAQALAHDANNLLSALRLYGELLCFSGVLHERHRHYAEDLKLLSTRSEKIIDRLIGLAEQVTRAGTVAPAPAGETSSLAAVLDRMKGLLGTIAQGELEVVLGAGDEMRVAAPADTLERILVNLTSNAAAAIREGGAIRIRAAVFEQVRGKDGGGSGWNANRRGGDGPGPSQNAPIAVLTVDDSGCGMSEAQVRAALGQAAGEAGEGTAVGWRDAEVVPGRVAGRDPARDPGRDKGAASSSGVPRRHRGLGLAIVRELVAATGGRLAVQSRLGTGTRIEICWTAAASEFAPTAELLAGPITESRQGVPQRLRPGVQPETGFAGQTGWADLRAVPRADRATVREKAREAGLPAAAKGAVA